MTSTFFFHHTAATVSLQGPRHVLVSGHISLHCTVDDVSEGEVERLEWYHNGSLVEIADSTSSRKRVSEDEYVFNNQTMTGLSSSTLQVVDVRREDGGEYGCRAVLSNETEVSLPNETEVFIQ